jgi:trk system potassium uptake protein TrkA
LNHGKLISLALLKEGELEVIELVAQKNSKINNRPLKLIDFPDNTIIGAIIRNDEIIIPHGEDFIMEGDKVFLFTQRTKIKKIEHFFM